ncbi:MAG: cyclic nucleotide-binding domain-containing protein [Deltaproteobacteria bacterium]|nr:cyclic nucleotide-binding domain-containing protein [Deltaproteobacteria bacterium]
MKIFQLYGELSSKRATKDHRRVLELGIALVNTIPDDPSIRLAVADSLVELGKKDEAARVYKAVVWHCSKAGFPLAAVAAAKLLGNLEPGMIEDALEVIVGLYSKNSDRIGPPGLPFRPTQGPERNLEIQAVPNNVLSMDELVQMAAETCESTEGTMPYPEKLPAIPMFSRLDEDVFLEILDTMQVTKAAKGECVIEQGEPGDSLFLVADGRLEAVKTTDRGERIRLGVLNEGSVFGEMSVITNEPRTASVVVSRDSLLLKITRDKLVSMADKAEPVALALEGFRRERLVYNLMSISPLFMPLDREERFSLLEQFGTYEIKAGTALLEQGKPGRGLYLVLHGECEVTKDHEKVATLKEGDVFGEISLIKETPANATVATGKDSVILFLAREAFSRVKETHPEISSVLDQLAEQRVRGEMPPRLPAGAGEPVEDTKESEEPDEHKILV